MRRIGIPAPFRLFSADITWWVPRKIRTISRPPRRSNAGCPPDSVGKCGLILFDWRSKTFIIPEWGTIGREATRGGNDILFHHHIVAMSWIGAAALAVNIPLGYLREGTRKYSLAWFVCIHLSIPLIAFLRIRHDLNRWAIPVFIACAIAGQIAGGRLRKRFRGDG